MKLPDLCNSMKVGRLRHIQSIHEDPELRNPDTLVRDLLPALQRWCDAWLNSRQLRTLREDPFYYYLIARTKYYDDIFTNAIRSGINLIVNIGAGSDTRAYRFAPLLRQHRVAVIECDLPALIDVKQRLTKRFSSIEHVRYLPLDLNQCHWSSLFRELDAHADKKCLVFMEGVSPYVEASAFRQFLSMLADKLLRDSCIAYDFKLAGIDDSFWCHNSAGTRFRLPDNTQELSAFHARVGLSVEHFELSSDVSIRLLPHLTEAPALFFYDDGLVRVRAKN